MLVNKFTFRKYSYLNVKTFYKESECSKECFYAKSKLYLVASLRLKRTTNSATINQQFLVLSHNISIQYCLYKEYHHDAEIEEARMKTFMNMKKPCTFHTTNDGINAHTYVYKHTCANAHVRRLSTYMQAYSINK